MYQVDNEKFGRFLSQRRKEKSMTQKELADRLFVSDKTVSKWERGNSMPNVSLLIPLAETLEITVTELLKGERKEEEALLHPAEEFGEGSLEETVRQAMERKKRSWIAAFFLSVLLVIGEAVFLKASGFPLGQTKECLYASALLLFCGGWVCVFAKDTLPAYYDKNKISFVSQGIFRIHLAGLALHNGNWRYVLTVVRIFSLGTAVLCPILCYVSFTAGGEALWELVKNRGSMILAIGALLVIYFVGKKYE